MIKRLIIPRVDKRVRKRHLCTILTGMQGSARVLFTFTLEGEDLTMSFQTKSTRPLSSSVLVTTCEVTRLILFTLMMTIAVFLTGQNDKISVHL